MRLALFLTKAIENLKHAEFLSPALDARVLVGHALGLDRAGLLSQSERDLTDEEIKRAKALLARRAAGEPVARILGKREFWGLEFGLNEATLEPRPDSETLVEAVLELAQGKTRLLDLGTGTGCLLLALLHEMREATGVGIDISPRAVEQAAANAEALGLKGRVDFRAGDWLSGINERFDVVISNPPYIPSRDVDGLMREVKDFDPLRALDGGDDGLEPYRIILATLNDVLNPKGIVAFEVGQGQAQDVMKMLRSHGFTDVIAHRDLGGIERCVTGVRGA